MGVIISPVQAARRVGISRRTIMRGIETQQLQARRDNTGWRINVDVLDAWAASRIGTRIGDPEPAHPVQPVARVGAHAEETIGLRVALATAAAERDALAVRLAETRAALAAVTAELDATAQRLAEAQAALSAMTVDRNQLRERLEEARADRDAWRVLASQSWWSRFIGR